LAIVALGLASGCDPAGKSYAPKENPPLHTGSYIDETLRQLTTAVRAYHQTHKTIPPTFRDFAVAAGIRIPIEPTGKKFVLDTNTLEVLLVNR